MGVVFLLACCCRSGAECARVGPCGDEELLERDARVQVRHERQDRHRQAGESRSGRRHREEVTKKCTVAREGSGLYDDRCLT